MKIRPNLKKLSQTIITIGVSLIAFSSASAWGPERATFTMENPATYPTFNSITNNPTIGDERNFVRVGEIGTDVKKLKNEIAIVPGKQYLVYIYFHNNASSTYNDSAHNNVGVAVRTRMSSSFPTMVTPSAKGTVSATITADNSKPTSVWDEAYFTTTSERVFLKYVDGSAKIYNDWKANNSIMPTTLFTKEGALIGLNTLNGIIPGCEEYHGVVAYVLQAEALSGTIDKTVSKDGKNYSEQVSIKASEEVYFKLAIKNTGDLDLANTIVTDSLPAGLTLVPGSVEIAKSETREKASDTITTSGLNLGTIGKGGTTYVYFRAKAGDDFACDPSELTNTATLTYDDKAGGSATQKDTAKVSVSGECTPTPTCETNPELPECQEKPTCETNPELPECQEKPTCETNPEMEGCEETPEEIVSTGPVEIILAIVIIIGIGGGCIYFYRTRKALKTVEDKVSGKDLPKS